MYGFLISENRLFAKSDTVGSCRSSSSISSHTNIPANNNNGASCCCRRIFIIVSVVVLLIVVDRTDAGCSFAKQCCEGKNNTCRQDGPRISNNDSFTCFCDAACFQLRDCCTDYNATCLPVDCVLDDEWEAWTPCDVTCGLGIKQRRKRVVRQPANGGRDCEAEGLIVEKAVCHGESLCDGMSPESPTPQPAAGLLPSPASARIHQPLPEPVRLLHPPDSDSVKYVESARIIPVGHDSGASDWRQQSPSKRVSDRIVLQDNIPSTHGHRYETTYHSLYELTDMREACQEYADDRWPAQGPRLKQGMTVCVQCQPLAKKKRLGDRCEGEGTYQEESRWISITMPGCRGKWKKLIQQQETGRCPEFPGNMTTFVFV